MSETEDVFAITCFGCGETRLFGDMKLVDVEKCGETRLRNRCSSCRRDL